MKRPSFFEGVAVALAASVAGSAGYAVLGLLLPAGTAARLLIAGLGLAYLLYLLGRSRERVGRVTAVAAWAAVAAVTWLAAMPFALYLLVHLGLVWLLRSLYFHAGVLSALADLGLGVLGLMVGVWALTSSGSLWLSLWSFFLVQALFVAIPDRPGPAGAQVPDDPDDFQRAHRNAERALRGLASLH